MNVTTPTLMPGARSLPAELMIPRQYRKVDWGMQRLLTGGPNRMQSAGGVRGIRGIGDTCYDTTSGSPYPCDASGNPLDMSGGSGVTPTVVPAGDSSINWGALTNVITVGSTSLARILAASNPGTYYKDPQGNVIYSQPTGNTQNLPGVYGNVGGGPGATGTFTTPIGSGTIAGISSNTLMMVAVVGLMAVMVMGRR